MVKFGVFADLHVDIMHDTQERMEKMMEAFRKADVDFVVQLGDFCYPDVRKCICKPEHRPANISNAMRLETFADKEKILSIYRDFVKPTYHVIGNHDCDMCSKEDVFSFYGSDLKPYYSFDMCGYHFVAVDACYYKVGDEYISYENGNYFDCPFENGTLPWIPPHEMKWLEEDLMNAKYPSILFSHQRLMDGHSSIHNCEELRELIKKAPNGVILSVNGHEHNDNVEKVDDTYFYNMNSASCVWIGTKYEELGKYTPEIDEKYPSIRYVIPYDAPVYSIVTIDENGIKIEGTKANQVGTTAEQFGIFDVWAGKRLRARMSAEAKDRYLELKK